MNLWCLIVTLILYGQGSSYALILLAKRTKTIKSSLRTER